MPARRAVRVVRDSARSAGRGCRRSAAATSRAAPVAAASSNIGAALAVRRDDRHAAAGHAREQDRRRLSATSTITRRASNCSERLRTKRGQCCAPGIELAAGCDIIWQPLQTPSAKVSARAKKRSNSSRARALKQDRLGPALARAEHVAVGEAAAGGEALEAVERHAPGDDVAHVHVDRLEAGAVERRRHLDLAVDALLAQDGDARPRPRDERRGDVLVGSNVSAADRPGIAGVEDAVVLLAARSRGCRAALHAVAWSRDQARAGRRASRRTPACALRMTRTSSRG